MSPRRARWLAIPLATFLLVFGASFAYHSLAGGGPAPAAGGSEAPTSKSGERIVVAVRAREGESYLWVVGIDGSNPVQITHAPSDDTVAADASPAWSPDGESIAFTRQVVDSSGQSGRPYVYTVAPDGSKLRQLTREDAFDLGPAWSPDSSRILFGRLVGETTTDLFTIRRDGSDLVKLTSDPKKHQDLASFSPDGKLIAYTSVSDHEDIWVMDADGSGQRLLLGGRPSDGLPAWSPDGERIAFVRDLQIAVMNADGGGVTLLARGSRKGTHPQWSPDGRRILFTGHPWGIYVMNADGSGLVQVPIEGEAAGASWGPSS